jgi:hypothetical protein
MLDRTLTLPEDPEELRSFTARLLEEVKAQASLIESDVWSGAAGRIKPSSGRLSRRKTGGHRSGHGSLWRRDNLPILQSMIPTRNTVG